MAATSRRTSLYGIPLATDGLPVGPAAPTSPRVTQQTVGLETGAGTGGVGPMANGIMSSANVGAAPPSRYQTSNLTGKVFTGHAPGATPYGDFIAPNPGELSAAAKFRLDEGLKARQRSAAARGSLFNTGTLKELERFGSGLASQEYDNDYNRALDAYRTNRDTNAQNFGQATTQFRGDLDIFGANNRVGLDWANFDRSGQPPAGVGTTLSNANLGAIGGGMSTGGGGGTYADDYAAAVAAARAQNESESARLRGRVARTGLQTKVQQGAIS